jgi:putative autotransporter adhesin-like protein
MRLAIAFVVAAAALTAAAAASAASVEVKDAVARVTVIPENRDDIKVEFLSTNPRLPLKIRSFAGRTIVDGDLGRRIRSCHGSGQNVVVEVRGVGSVAWRDMPQVVVRTPRETNVEAGGAVFGSVGRSAALTLANAGCGDWTVANVEGRLHLSQAGSGDTHTGAAGEAKIRVAGSGDVWTAEVRGPLNVEVAGSGNVTSASVSGPLEVHVAGSGDVKVAGGHATSMSVAIAGSGDVEFGGVADSLKARIAGSGDVHAREVRGPISKAVMGSGGVTVGQ